MKIMNSCFFSFFLSFDHGYILDSILFNCNFVFALLSSEITMRNSVIDVTLFFFKCSLMKVDFFFCISV